MTYTKRNTKPAAVASATGRGASRLTAVLATAAVLALIGAKVDSLVPLGDTVPTDALGIQVSESILGDDTYSVTESILGDDTYSVAESILGDDTYSVAGTVLGDDDLDTADSPLGDATWETAESTLGDVTWGRV